jgi:hypothetical protein
VILPGDSGYRFDKPKQVTATAASNDVPIPDHLPRGGARSEPGLHAETAPRDPATAAPPQEVASRERRYADTAFARTTQERLGEASVADEGLRGGTADEAPASDATVVAVTSRPALEVPTVLTTPVPEAQPVEPEREMAAAVRAEVVTTEPEPVANERRLPTPAFAVPDRVRTKPDSVQKEAEREIEHLLGSAQTAYRQDFLTTPRRKSAYHFLRQVLDQDPANQAARHGMEQIVRRYRVLAKAALERQDYGLAQTLSRRGLNIRPGNESLQILHAKAELLHEEALEHQQALLNPALHDNDRRKRKKTGAGLFGEIRAFFNDLTPDEVSTDVVESEEAYWNH